MIHLDCHHAYYLLACGGVMRARGSHKSLDDLSEIILIKVSLKIGSNWGRRIELGFTVCGFFGPAAFAARMTDSVRPIRLLITPLMMCST